MQNQLYSFIIFLLNGLLIGLLFDTFRILRKSFKTPNFITYIEDVLFWILSGLIILYSIFKFENGVLRMYIFLGIIFGYLIYLLIFSKIYIKINLCLILSIKLLIKYLFIIPIRYIINILIKIIIKPTIYIFKKIYSRLKNFVEKNIKNFKKRVFQHKSYEKKKDFA